VRVVVGEGGEVLARYPTPSPPHKILSP